MALQNTPASTGGTRVRPPGITIVLLSLSFLWCLCWFFHSWGYWEDDAYIHLEFARSVAAGHGFTFNGKVVYGDTAPLWVFLLVGMHFLVPVWIVGGKVLTALGAMFALSGVYTLSKRLIAVGPGPGSDVFPAAMVMLFVTNPYFCYWSFSGMEALTAVGIVCWGAVVATDPKPSWGTFFTGCLLAGATPLLRPEMIFFSGILALLLLYRWYQISPVGFLIKKGWGFLAGLVLICGPVVGWGLYAVHTFGSVVPTTNAAKRAALGDSVALRLLEVYSLAFPIIVVGLLAGLAYLGLRTSYVKERIKQGTFFQGLPTAGSIFVILSLIVAVFYLANHTYIQTRYVFVTAPGLMIAIFAVIHGSFPKLYRVCYVASITFAVVISVTAVWPFIRNKSIGDGDIARFSVFVRTQLPPDAPIALFGIGEIAFLSEHPIVDTGGITRPGALNLPSNELVSWAKSQGARYYLTSKEPEPGAILVYSQKTPVVGWSLNYKHYSQLESLNLWKLVPVTAAEGSAPRSVSE
jgi:hypothetical protein